MATHGRIQLGVLNLAQLALSCAVLLVWPAILLLPERGPQPDPNLDPDAYLARLDRLGR